MICLYALTKETRKQTKISIMAGLSKENLELCRLVGSTYGLLNGEAASTFSKYISYDFSRVFGLCFFFYNFVKCLPSSS